MPVCMHKAKPRQQQGLAIAKEGKNRREFRFQTAFWSFKPNATSSDSFIAIDRVQFGIFYFRFQTASEIQIVWEWNLS